MAHSMVTPDLVARISLDTVRDHLEPRIDAVLMALRQRRKGPTRVTVTQDPARHYSTMTIEFEISGPEFIRGES